MSLSTAPQAFRWLEDTGWCEARPCSGDFVRRRAAVALDTLPESDGHRKAIAQAWNEETGGSHLVALYQLRLLLQRERERTGET